MTKVTKKISFRGQKIYVGIDVHKEKWTVCPLTEEVNFRAFSMASNAELLISYLHSHFPGGEYICAYEAGFSGYGLYESLWEAKITCLVIHAADIPTSHKESEFKTDPRDALKIAKALRSGDLSCIHIPDKQLQEDRSLIRYRQQLRKDIVRQKCRIKSFLAFYSIEIPESYTKTKWSRKMVGWLYNLELSIPGFGRLRSIEFLVSLGAIDRFSNLDKLSSYVGLIPSSDNSGNRVRQNQLTNRGHKQLRTMLIEAAWIGIRTDPSLALKYGTLKKRMLAQKAIVCIARKLLSRVRYVLVNEVAYQKGIEA